MDKQLIMSSCTLTLSISLFIILVDGCRYFLQIVRFVRNYIFNGF